MTFSIESNLMLVKTYLWDMGVISLLAWFLVTFSSMSLSFFESSHFLCFNIKFNEQTEIHSCRITRLRTIRVFYNCQIEGKDRIEVYYVICFNYFEDFSPHNFLICIFVEMDDLALGQFRNCSRLKARLKANIKFVPEIDCIIFIHHFQGKRSQLIL